MTGNAEPTHDKRSEEEIEREAFEEIPEWSEADFAPARPLREMFPDLAENLERLRGQRGPQKAPTKERIGLRIDREVVDHSRRTGTGWQSRINDILAAYVREHDGG
ncbi:BrnA antitoxin family protein [Mangrovicella endophytica]|uniref:BrnA antitoxin family protein n=1 Tax=Mangrovicella endophytica TaxID=2066697 RepID=UPI000C9DDADA|nr:BrnA antitoxin family protein [Mangrovicella endophytica]